MEQIVLKEQIISCNCPYCTKELIIIRDLEPKAKEQKIEIVKKAKKIVKAAKVPTKIAKVAHRTWKAWTSEDDEMVKSMSNLGVSAKKIGLKLGRTQAAIYTRKDTLAKLEGKAETEGFAELEIVAPEQTQASELIAINQ